MSLLAFLFILGAQEKPPEPKVPPSTEVVTETREEAPQGDAKVEPRPSGKALAAEPKPTSSKVADPGSLSFFSDTLPFRWNTVQPLSISVDGLKVNSIHFGKREPKAKVFQGPNYGTRAQVEVTNTAKVPRTPGFAVAVFDQEGRLLGAANGGTKIGTVKPGETETFDLSFFQVKDRLPKGDHYVLSVELRD